MYPGGARRFACVRLRSKAIRRGGGTAVDGGGPFHNIVEQINPNKTCFHGLRCDNKRSMTPPFRGIVFVGVVRRLQDLY